MISNLIALLSSEEWKQNALCLGRTDLFYPEYPVRSDRDSETSFERKVKLVYDNVDKAKAICQQCPVKNECELRGEREEFGIWGGVVREVWWDDSERT